MCNMIIWIHVKQCFCCTNLALAVVYDMLTSRFFQCHHLLSHAHCVVYFIATHSFCFFMCKTWHSAHQNMESKIHRLCNTFHMLLISLMRKQDSETKQYVCHIPHKNNIRTYMKQLWQYSVHNYAIYIN